MKPGQGAVSGEGPLPARNAGAILAAYSRGELAADEAYERLRRIIIEDEHGEQSGTGPSSDRGTEADR